MIEITFSQWVTEAGPGMQGTPRFEYLHNAATEGKLIIVDDKGKRFIPVSKNDNWVLEPTDK